jgi:AraC-like DNA-binding protein
MKALRLLFITVALAICIYIFTKILQKYQSHNIYFNQLKTWSIYILAIMLFHWIANILKYVPGIVKITGELMIPFGNLFVLLVILFRPKFLNRANLKITLGDFFTKKIHPELDEQLFVETFFAQTYYLKQEASVENLCKLLNVSSDALNNFIFTRYGSGLNDLINKQRVAYFIDLVSSGKLTDYTIDALAREAGFSSRHHLYKPFKKFHGGTPSDFIRSVVE